MNARTLRVSVFLVVLALAAGGANQALAQGPPTTQPTPVPTGETLGELRAKRDALKAEYDASVYEGDTISAWLILTQAYERDLREGRLVAVVATSGPCSWSGRHCGGACSATCSCGAWRNS
jgi:hypothetical protein